jgi:hypothetical protein
LIKGETGMGFFTKKIGTVFLKDTSDADTFIKKMQMFLQETQGDTKKKIETQIKLAEYGKKGEDNIAFELKNSGIDMYVLRDVYLEFGELTAQIDYIVITRKHIYVLECKNLIGDIEIDNAGNFIRSYEVSGKRIREGIYSPITQNQRHLKILKEVRSESKGNFLAKLVLEKSFEDNYKSVVVLANPKTCLNAKFAKKEIKEQVIRADQLISYIEKTDANGGEASFTANDMLELAQFYLDVSQPNKSDYARKYEEILHTIDGSNHVSKEQLVKQLKAFRLEQSRKENIKPYYIFNDAQMNDLMEKSPTNKEELLKVSGFGNVKVEKYGESILNILNENKKL